MTWRSLFCDISEDGTVDKSKASLGRVSFWLTYLVACYYWLFKPDTPFPETLLWFLFILVGYNFAKKGAPIMDNLFQTILARPRS